MAAGLTLSPPGMAQAQNKSVGEYLAIAKRRRKTIGVTAIVVFIIALLIAFLWPATYRSSATILIEEQEIPMDMVRSTITSFANQQIHVIKQRTMTISNIMEMVKKFELYTDEELARTPRMEIAEDFQKAVGVNVISADVVDPRLGRPVQAMIAFGLSFEGSEPKKVQKVASELVNLYLNENLRNRTEKTASTSEFIRDEVAMLNKELQRIDEEIAEFKLENKDALPDRFAFNVQNLARQQSQLDILHVRLREINKRELELESNLAQTNAYSPTTLPTGQTILADVDRLKALQSEYRRKAAAYNASHPDIKKLRREIDALIATVGHAGDKDDLLRLLKDRQSELLSLQDKYAADHPEVRLQEKLIEQIQAQIAMAESGDPDVVPDNPSYIFMANQLSSLRMEKAALEEEELELKEEIAELEEAVALSPGVEKEYVRMQRDMMRTQAEHNALAIKLREAMMAGSLEEDRKGQRFTLIQPAMLPEQPVRPNRMALVFGGLILSVLAGCGLAILQETMDQSIQSEKALALVTGEPPLASISYISSPAELEKTRPGGNWLLWVAVSVVALVLALVLVHNVYKPLDVLWFVIMRKLGLN